MYGPNGMSRFFYKANNAGLAETLSRMDEVAGGFATAAELPTWTPKVCKIMAQNPLKVAY